MGILAKVLESYCKSKNIAFDIHSFIVVDDADYFLEKEFLSTLTCEEYYYGDQLWHICTM